MKIGDMLYVCIHSTYTYVCMYVCVYVCMYVYSTRDLTLVARALHNVGRVKCQPFLGNGH